MKREGLVEEEEVTISTDSSNLNNSLISNPEEEEKAMILSDDDDLSNSNSLISDLDDSDDEKTMTSIDLEEKEKTTLQERKDYVLETLDLIDDMEKIKSKNKKPTTNQSKNGFFSKIKAFFNIFPHGKAHAYARCASDLKMTVEERFLNSDLHVWDSVYFKFLDKTVITFAEAINEVIIKILKDKKVEMKEYCLGKLGILKNQDEKSIDNSSGNEVGIDEKNRGKGLLEIFKPNIALENIPYKVKKFLLYELEDLRNKNRDIEVEFNLFFLLTLASLGCEQINTNIEDLQMNMLDAGGKVGDYRNAFNVAVRHKTVSGLHILSSSGFFGIALGAVGGVSMCLLKKLADKEGEEVFKSELYNILKDMCCDNLECMKFIMCDIIAEIKKKKENILTEFIRFEKRQRE